MYSIANGTVFDFEDFLNFALAVGDLFRCATNWPVVDEVADLGERSELSDTILAGPG